VTLARHVANADLCAAINRLLLHNDPVELALLTDEQFALYLDACGKDEHDKRIICQTANRPFPGDDYAARNA
jgi:hypothetical protein